MKQILVGFLALLGAAIAALAWSLRPATLPVPAGFAVQIPAANPPADLKLSVLYTGKILGKAGLAYLGGSLTEDRTSAMAPNLPG